MKKYDFDEVIDRRGTGSIKYDALKSLRERDLLLSVADTDFRTGVYHGSPPPATGTRGSGI